jgi:hypothetical protein
VNADPEVQVPGFAVSGVPTAGVPVIVGAALLATARSSKCTKPVGQLLLDFEIRRQWKSPLQLSSEITIVVAFTTSSTYATWPLEPTPSPAFHQATEPTMGVLVVIFLLARPQL